MSDNFNTYNSDIDFDVWRDICMKMGRPVRYSRGEEFVTAGETGRYIGFIVSGSLKYVAFSEDGTEHVMGLVFGEGFVADWPFCMYGAKARLSIVAVSDCDIYCIPTSIVKRMIVSEPGFKEIVMRSTEAVYATVYERYIDLYCKTPQQRYNELSTRHPNLFNLFSLKDIASFLNVTPTHLSRLRKHDAR